MEVRAVWKNSAFHVDSRHASWLDPHIETVFVQIRGKVQGVGFRMATVRRAHHDRRHRLGAEPAATAPSKPWCKARRSKSTRCWNGWAAVRRAPLVRDVTSRREYTEKRYRHFQQL